MIKPSENNTSQGNILWIKKKKNWEKLEHSVLIDHKIGSK